MKSKAQEYIIDQIVQHVMSEDWLRCFMNWYGYTAAVVTEELAENLRDHSIDRNWKSKARIEKPEGNDN